ncbi:MAG TPA: TetR/AcrR family transcriptional regulator [Caulobacteraceae bacterium]|nr:TetR/AcrR family transcriptional regulator [Caulobacteraceae bacterium]
MDDTSPESVRSEARRRAILDVAREVFLKEGYAAASMSNIAARLGGSKGTLYNYFRSKEDLFAAFMVDTCKLQADALFDHLPPFDDGARPALESLAEAFLEFILESPVLSVHRVVVAEAERFPELGRIFYETGPKTGEDRLTVYMQRMIDAGVLRDCDARNAARRFKDLVLSDVQHRTLWGVMPPMDAAARKAQAAESVDLFLRAFAA